MLYNLLFTNHYNEKILHVDIDNHVGLNLTQWPTPSTNVHMTVK